MYTILGWDDNREKLFGTFLRWNLNYQGYIVLAHTI